MKKTQKIIIAFSIISTIFCSAGITSMIVYKKLKPNFDLLTLIVDDDKKYI